MLKIDAINDIKIEQVTQSFDLIALSLSGAMIVKRRIFVLPRPPQTYQARTAQLTAAAVANVAGGQILSSKTWSYLETLIKTFSIKADFENFDQHSHLEQNSTQFEHTKSQISKW